MQTMEESIAMLADHIIALTEDESRDVVPIMYDIRRAAEGIKKTLEEGDPIDLASDLQDQEHRAE
jgi:hypothetical protein